MPLTVSESMFLSKCGAISLVSKVLVITSASLILACLSENVNPSQLSCETLVKVKKGLLDTQ